MGPRGGTGAGGHKPQAQEQWRAQGWGSRSQALGGLEKKGRKSRGRMGQDAPSLAITHIAAQRARPQPPQLSPVTRF